MEVEKKHLTPEEANNINNKINDVTEAIFKELEGSGLLWLPIMVYATLNVMTVATEMSKHAGNENANLKDITETFCNQLLESVNIRNEFVQKNFN